MTTTMTTTTTTTTKTTPKPADPAPASCAGSGCGARDPWPAHHLRIQGSFCALCTSCVLKYHRASFCSVCFALLDPSSKPPLVQCSKCRASVCHRSCASPALDFICASCSSPNTFEYFPKKRPDGKRRLVNVDSAKALLAAARIAANSMSKAAAVTKADADRKVKEAVVSRKRARDMLYRAFANWEGGKKGGSNNNNASSNDSTVTTNIALAKLHLRGEDETRKAAEEPRKRAVRAAGGSVDQKRVQSREIEKWMRFHEPIPIAAAAQGVGEDEKAKGGSLVDAKSRVGSVGQEEKLKKGGVLSGQSGGGVVKKEAEKSMVVDMVIDSEMGRPRLPQLTQDALMSRTNPRAMFSGSQSTASLHS